MGRFDDLANPDDPHDFWRDRGRPVGDGTGMPRVPTGCAASLAVVLLIGVGTLLGGALTLAVAYLLAAPGGLVVGVLIIAGAVVAITALGRLATRRAT